MRTIKPLDLFYINGQMGVPVDKPAELGDSRGFIAWKGLEELLRRLDLLKPDEKVSYYAGGNGGISFYTKKREPYTASQVRGVAKTWIKHLSSQLGPEMPGFPGQRQRYIDYYRTAISNLTITKKGDRLKGGSHKTTYSVNGVEYDKPEDAAVALNKLEGIPDAKT